MCPSLLYQASDLCSRRGRAIAALVFATLGFLILMILLATKHHGRVELRAANRSFPPKIFKGHQGSKPRREFASPDWLNSNWTECFKRGDLVALYILHQDIAERSILDSSNTTPVWLSDTYKEAWMNRYSQNLTYGNMILQVCYRYLYVVFDTEYSHLTDNETNVQNNIDTYDAVMTFLELYKVLSSLKIKEVAIRNFIATEIFYDYEEKLYFTPGCTNHSLRMIMEHVRNSVPKLKADIDLFFTLLQNQHYTSHRLNKGFSLNEIEKDTCPTIRNFESILSPLGLEFLRGKKRFSMLTEMFKQLRERITFIKENYDLARVVLRPTPAWLAVNESRLWNHNHLHCLKRIEILVEDRILTHIKDLELMTYMFHLPKLAFRVEDKDLKKSKLMSQEIVCHSLPICDLSCL